MPPPEARRPLHCGTALKGCSPFGAAPEGAPPHRADLLTQSSADWRRATLRAEIPAGYTYLAQLLGHDMGLGVPADEIPALVPEKTRAEQREGAGRNRVNLIRVPLSLESVYGVMPGLLTHLYDPATLQFRLGRHATLSAIADLENMAQGRPVRALYDERNRDTLMLHELTVAFMQYHNHLMRNAPPGLPPRKAMARARAIAVATWHRIIRSDLLPRFVHPQIMARAPGKLAREWELDEITLQHGLFRAFHSLPLSSYPLAAGAARQGLDLLMKPGTGLSMAEREGWSVDWHWFLVDPDGPRTAISASIDPRLRIGSAHLAELDLLTAIAAHPFRPSDPAIESAIEELGKDDQAYLQDLVREFSQRYPMAPAPVSAEALCQGPLYYFLQIEAQLRGHQGGFGPFGSALLRASVEASMNSLSFSLPGDVDPGSLPATMFDLITFVRS